MDAPKKPTKHEVESRMLKMENRKIQMELAATKDLLRQEIRRREERAVHDKEVHHVCHVVTRLRRHSQNQQRSAVAQFPRGAIIGRRQEMASHLAPEDEKVQNAIIPPPLGPVANNQTRAEELRDLQILREAWELATDRYAELKKLEEDAAAAASGGPKGAASSSSSSSEMA